jgi:hypothetical protein
MLILRRFTRLLQPTQNCIGTGVNTQAKLLLLTHAFETLIWGFAQQSKNLLCFDSTNIFRETRTSFR